MEGIGSFAAKLAAVVFLFLALPAVGFCEAAKVGDAVPPFALPEVVGGEVVDVAEHLDGAPGAIVFMQTSCSACRKELKVFKALVQKYPGFKVVAVSVDAGGAARVVRYKEGYEFPFLFVHDPDYEKPALFGFSYTPSLVLVDGAGKVALLKGGFRPGDDKMLEENVAGFFK